MLAFLIAAAAVAQTAVPAQPGRDKALLHRHLEQLVEEKQAEQEQDLRKLLALGGSEAEQAEVTARLASALRARGLTLAIRSQAEQDRGEVPLAEKDRALSARSRTEAIARYRELLKKYPKAEKQDEALFFLADTLQDSSKDDEAVESARDLVRRFPNSQWAPSSHVFIGEHLFEEAKLAEALTEYRAAIAVPSDEIYPYALYKAAWCRFNQSGFADAMNLLHQVVAVSLGGDATRPISGQAQDNKVQLAREARRDYVLVYSRVGKPEAARGEFLQKFGPESGRKMLELYGKLLFDTGRDQEAQLIHRQLLELHGDEPAAALDQTRLLVISARGGKRRELLHEAQILVETFRRVQDKPMGKPEEKEALEEARRLGEETLRTLAVQTHNEARKTELDDTWAAAKALYADYLILFPDAPEAYELRFFDGELLYGRGERDAAAELYEAVVKQDLAAQRSKQKEGRWLSKAAWSAVLSRDEATHPSAAAARANAKSGKAEKPTILSSAQRPLTGKEKLLGRACALYLEALPGGQHAVEVAFKLGRLDYLANDLDAAEQQLAWVAQVHPENELAEYAANLVLDISNLRHDWAKVHAWALKFLADKKLLAHGTLSADLKRIEEESAYALADNLTPDAQKARGLLDFAEAHPRGELVDKAIFGAAAALSRAGRIDDALTARARLWTEQPGSLLVPRALLASAADHGALGDFGDAALLLEKYAGGFRRQEETRKWRREHPQTKSAKGSQPSGPLFEEAKAQGGLHDAAVLREARGELSKSLADRTLALQLWKNAPDRDLDESAAAMLRARLGQPSRAARDLAEVARRARGKPFLQLAAWRDSARLFVRLHEFDHASWAFTVLEREYRALGPKAREKLPPDLIAAVAEAHFALGAKAFDNFKQQRIEQPLMRTLNRKIALLQIVKKRDEETVAMRQAEPAVCALSQLGEAQMLLAQGIATSPVPMGLSGEQRKLYRDAINEKAQPLFADAKETLQGAQGRARELGVTSACATRTAALLEKLGVKTVPRPQLTPLPAQLSAQPGFIDAEGRPVESEPGDEQQDEQHDAVKLGVAQGEESR